MSTFKWRAEVSPPGGGPRAVLDFFVDTGAVYTWIRRSTLERLGVTPTDKQEFQTADGRVIERDMGEVTIRLDGRSRTTPCVFADESSPLLLGAVTLEQFALAADLVNKRFVPIRVLPALAEGA